MSDSARTLGTEVFAIRSAAAVEATAFGHPEVDVEHLLLGLMVVGGPSAQVLTAAGAELAALRRAVGEVQQEDLGELGVDVATPQPSPVRAADRLHQVLPLNGRAAELMEAIAYRNDDRGLLEALLADGSGRVRRLLDHLDVDVDVRGLIGQEPFLSQSERREPRAAPIPPPEGLVWMTASSGQVVPVSPERVWALMRDVARRTEWDVTCSGVTTDADGDQLVTRTGGDAVTDTIVGIVPGREITWRVRYPGRACPRSCRSS